MQLLKDKEIFKVTKDDKKEVTGLKNTIKAFKLVHIDKKALSLIIILFVISIAINIFNALISKELLNVFTTQTYDRLYIFAIILIITTLFYQIVSYYHTHFYDKFIKKFALDMKIKTYERITDLKASCFSLNQTSTFTRRLYDSSNIVSTFDIIFNTIYTLATTLSYSVILFIYAPILSCVCVAFYMIRIVFNKVVIPKYSALRKRNRKLADEANNLAVETVRGSNDLNSLNIGNNLKDTYNSKNDYQTSQMFSYNVWWRKRSFPTNFFAYSFNSAVLLVLIAVFSSVSVLNATAILFFWSYKGNINTFFTSLINVTENFANIEISASRMMELYDDEKFPSATFGNKDIDVVGNINFNKVSFSYEPRKPILKEISFNIEANKITAIVGKTGCGKSTTLSLIARFYDPKKGKITLDGVDIKDLSKKCLRENIGYVQQSPYIFNRSFKENLLLVKPDATDAEIEKACKLSEIHSFIMTTKDKYDTLIGENGITLSGGQRQRLAIARALLNNSKIIMFDESTSSLDNENQAKIQAAIENLAKNHTIIVVAHRLSTIINADKIIFMDKHKIVAEGTHKELFETCEEYRKLYEIENK